MEIRMLGPLRVRRADGTAVADGEWRTAKTLDLLRLLALHNGEPVPVSSVIDKLWPDVEETRGRASLRTAASQLRKVLGEDCVDRCGGGLVLQGAWVDTQAYEALLGDARASSRVGDHARTVAIVEEAEALYLGDLDLPDAPGDWHYEARDHLRRLRCRALLDAAEAAAALCWMRDSLELAQRAASLDTCEEAARAMMRALGALGEIRKALAVFDSTRRELADRYGVDPSPQTRALHLQLLTGTAARTREPGLAGQAGAVQGLASVLAGMARRGPTGGVVWLQGEPGSGRDSVARAATRAAGLSLDDLSRDPWRGGEALVSRSELSGEVVLMPHAETVPHHALKVIDTLARQHGGVLVVPVTHAPEDPGAEDVDHQVVSVGALDDPALQELAELVLQGTPSDRLLWQLRTESGGLAGAACSVAREWLAEGRVLWSVEGLELADASRGHLLADAVGLRRALRLLSPFAEDLVNVLAVVDAAVPAEELEQVALRLRPAAVPEQVGTALAQLVDAELVGTTRTGYRLRETHLNAQIVAWLRPHLRQQLHRLVAECVSVPPARRAAHLAAAGEHPLAARPGASEAALADVVDAFPGASSGALAAYA